MARTLTLARVLSLIGGLALVGAFFMPWFGSQGLLLSGQFLHNFLAGASPVDMRRFLPTSSPTEVQLLRLLVDLFPACGIIAAAAALLGGLVRGARSIGNILLGLCGVLSFAAWAVGLTRLPPGSSFEVGLWLMGAASIAILLGLAFEIGARPRAPTPDTQR